MVPAAIPYGEVRYNRVRARASHNSYQRDEDIPDQMIFWHLRSIELDIHSQGGEKNWYVYHHAFDQGTNVNLLSEAMSLLYGFHLAFPEHEVVTVSLDVISNFDGKDHTPDTLDAVLNRGLPQLIYKPGDLLGSTQGNLQDIAQWPLLKDLRGKFIFILTTGDLDSATSNLNNYLGTAPASRTCFVAPEITESNRITDTRYKNAVFFNFDVSRAATLGPAVFDAGYVSRGFGANSKTVWDTAVASKVHLIGTDKVNTDVDPWSRTHTETGWPFEGIGTPVFSNTSEPGTFVTVTVQSDDLFDRKDSCVYFHVSAPSTFTRFVYAVSSPSSNTPDKNGKAGIMARASLDDDSANFAVVRVADNNQPRVQVRKTKGASTDQYKLDPGDTAFSGISGESWIWVRLDITDGGKTLRGLTSPDGVNWVDLHEQKFDSPLTVIGLVATSHDNDKSIRYVFIPAKIFLETEPIPYTGTFDLIGGARAGQFTFTTNGSSVSTKAAAG